MTDSIEEKVKRLFVRYIDMKAKHKQIIDVSTGAWYELDETSINIMLEKQQ